MKSHNSAHSCDCRECREAAALFAPKPVIVTFGMLDTVELPLPPKPTRAIPGTERKRLVMAWRFEHGYSPTHPADLTVNQQKQQAYLEAMAGL